MASTFSLRTFSTDEDLVKKRRNHIVQCATKAFTKQGFSQTTMREIAKACQMSSGNLYHYFGAKDEILYSIINTATSLQAECLENFTRDLDSMSPTDALVQLIRKLLQWHDENQDVTLFTYQETKNLPRNARQDIFDSECRIVSLFEKLLRSGIDSGEFTINHPKLMAHTIVTIGHTWALRRWFLRRYWTFETFVNEQTSAILKAVRRDTSAIAGDGSSNEG